MIAALIIVFREMIEAGLIVGIVLAVTRGVPGRGRWIIGGLCGGVAGAVLIAAFTDVISNALSGMGQEVFNAAVLASAVIMLAWHNIWMARHGREMAQDLKDIGEAVRGGNRSLMALAIVIGVAVLREGAEVVLFLYGVMIQGEETAKSILAGTLAGVALGSGVSALTYLGLAKIPPRLLFAATTSLITFLAAGMAAQSTLFLEHAGVVTLFGNQAWDTSSILSDTSLLGRVLHTLIGYNDGPSALQVCVYLVVLQSIFTLTRLLRPASPITVLKMVSA
jgi:high-affinity iron transporter